MQACFIEEDFIQSETAHLFFVKPGQARESSKYGQLLCLNADQNMFTYDIHLRQQRLNLEKVSSKCLYLDEVIDLKFIQPENNKALLCSNSESLKLMDLDSGETELYAGHTDIVLCLDTSAARSMFLTGAKDNQIRLWQYKPEEAFQRRLNCLAVFQGHNENVSSVCFAPKR